METKHECPFGMDCEKAENNVLTRCTFFMKVVGTDPNTGEDFDRWQCAVTLIPMMLIENSSKLQGVQAATESIRNENVTIGSMLTQAINNRSLISDK